MSAVVKEIYDAFRSAGVTDELATAAAQSIPVSTDLATKADIRGIHVEFGEVRAEIGEVRAELGAEIGSARADLGAEIASVRADLGAEIASVRADLGAEIASVRADLGAEIASLRADLGAEIASVRAEMKNLELRMTVKLYSALGVAVAGVKALDFLIG